MSNNENFSILFFGKLIQEFKFFIKEKLIFIFFLGLIGSIIGFFIASRSVPIYSAKVRFLMKESNNGSSFLSSLGSLGSLIGNSGGNISAYDRTIAILGSNRVISGALFKTINIEGKSDLAINHYIEINNLKYLWRNDSLLKDVKFDLSSNNIDSLDLKHRKAFKIILNDFTNIKSTVFAKSYDKKSGVFNLTVNTRNENFSIKFSETLFKELEQFMYNQSINVSGKNVDILTEKIDSIKLALNSVQNSLARNTDRTLGLLMQEDKVEQKKLLIKEQMLTVMYGEAQKNLETFKFVKESINPSVEILEYPISPIQPSSKSKLKFTFLGFFTCELLLIAYFFIKKWLTNLASIK